MHLKLVNDLMVYFFSETISCILKRVLFVKYLFLILITCNNYISLLCFHRYLQIFYTCTNIKIRERNRSRDKKKLSKYFSESYTEQYHVANKTLIQKRKKCMVQVDLSKKILTTSKS